MDEEMLEAHVAFEVNAWTASLDETLGGQVAVVLEWLDSVSLGSVFSDADLDAGGGLEKDFGVIRARRAERMMARDSIEDTICPSPFFDRFT